MTSFNDTMSFMATALVCPHCPNIYLNDMTSLICHFYSSHNTPEMNNSLQLTFASISNLIQKVPKYKILKLVPAYVDDFANQFPAVKHLFCETNNNNLVSNSNDKGVSMMTTPKTSPAILQSPQKQFSFLEQININNRKEQQVEQRVFGEKEAKRVSKRRKLKGETSTDVNSSKAGNLYRVQQDQGQTLIDSLFEDPNQRKPRGSQKYLGLICKYCGKQFQNRCQISRHEAQHKTKYNPYICPIQICIQSFESRPKLRNHITRLHKDSLTETQINTVLSQGDVMNVEMSKSKCNQSLADLIGNATTKEATPDDPERKKNRLQDLLSKINNFNKQGENQL